MAVTCEVLDSLEAVEPAAAEWDRLAVDAGLPYCAPAWLLAWWRNAAPAGARLRVAVASDGARVVGVAPFFAEPWRAGLSRWSLLASDVSSRIEPLAEPSLRPAVARAMAAALTQSDPRPARMDLNGLPAASYWPRALCAEWPGGLRPRRYWASPTPAPTVPLTGVADLDAWLGTRSSNFRQQMRRARRKFENDGGSFRVAAAGDLPHDLAEFERLHHGRWAERGGSAAMVSGIDRMLADAGRALMADGRFLLVSMVLGGRTISSHLFLAAGSELTYWNGGFDAGEAAAAYKPAMSTLVEAVRVAIEGGYARLDLGPGAQDYKYRFSDAQDELIWQTLVPPGRTSPLAHALSAPEQARYTASRRLSAEQKARVKRLLRR